MSTSRQITVDSKRLHFHKMGNGPALVMLHPSPHTSELLLPIAQKLTNHYTVFAVDTPGYGKSDGLGFQPTSIYDYTQFLHIAFEVMGLKKFALYGSATGAQLAIRYALEYPNEISNVFLDNSAHFDWELRKAILKNYFPDLTPQKDGGHLVKIWNIVSNMFQYFPWCFQTENYFLNRPQLPSSALHFIALDYLNNPCHSLRPQQDTFRLQQQYAAHNHGKHVSDFRWGRYYLQFSI